MLWQFTELRLNSAILSGWLLLATAAVFVAPAQDRLSTDSTPASWQDDAELTDVFFLDASTGWAVGAQGTILRTINGGRDWHSLGQATAAEVAPEMGLQEKIRAMQQGARTQHTGVADGSVEEPNPFRCRFESVFFIDAKNGWVAGGYDVPYLNHSRGILLRTADGGVTWRRVQGTLIPRIKRIHFSDRAHGWAVGDRGNLFPGSIFFTTDGGETWSNQSLQKERTLPADCIDADATEHGFVAIDDRGQLISVRNGQQELAVLESNTLPQLNQLKMLDRQNGWAIGDAGVLWRTQNGGASWGPLTDDPDSPLAIQMKPFDWLAIASSPTKIWLAGNPGSRLISIDRTSGEVLSYSTGVSTPIKGIYFADDQHGWLVGTLGTILATSDGGQTWSRQRGRHQGLAILGLAYDALDLPLEELAVYSAEEDWLMGVVTFHGQESDSARQAVERLGGIGVFSIASRELPETSSGAHEQQISRLVKLIRTLRPTVILCSSEYRKQPGTHVGHNAGFDPYLIVSTAVQAAASREAYVEQFEIAKLDPWTVERVAYRAPAGDLTIDPKRMLLRLGCLCEDRASTSRSLLNMPLTLHEKKSYRIDLVNGGSKTNSDLFSGLNTGNQARSIPHRYDDKELRLRTNRASIELANRKNDKMAELVRFNANTEQDLILWNQKVQEWLAPIDETLAGIWVAQLAERYLANGQVELAAKSLEFLVYRFHGHPLRAASLVWLMQYYSSDEFARIELSNLSHFRAASSQTTISNPDGARVGRSSSQTHLSYRDGQTIMVWTPVADQLDLPNRPAAQAVSTTDTESVPTGEIDPNVRPATFSEPPAGPQTDEVQTYLQSRWRRASNYLGQLGQEDPDLTNQLSFRYLEANLKRKLTNASTSEPVFKRIVLANEKVHGLSAAAEAELALRDANPEHPRSGTIRAVFVENRPHLDGQLDDEVWQVVLQNHCELKRTAGAASAGPNRARGWSDVPPADNSDQLMFAQNGQYLFVAVRCQKLPGQFYQMSPDARPRDPDLSRRDRVEFQFDVDRDFQTSFKFSVDYRGWGSEELNGATGWNPTWFIARSEDATSWTLEIAIPFDSLIPSLPAANVNQHPSFQLNSANSEMSATTQVVKSPLEDDVWSVGIARLTTDRNLWNPTTNVLEKSELSKGLYQQIQMNPANFQFFTFR